MRITDAGRAALAAAIPRVVAFEQRMMSALLPDEAAQLNALLHRVLAHLD